MNILAPYIEMYGFECLMDMLEMYYRDELNEWIASHDYDPVGAYR